MQAVRIRQFASLDELRAESVPIPDIGPDEILVRVHAAGVNPVDWKVRAGYLKDAIGHRLPLTLGWDVAGHVASVGALVTRFKAGDIVFAQPDMRRDGAYAEFVAVRADEAAIAPRSIPLDHAAAAPLSALTAWAALMDKGKLRRGQSVLVHAAAGGVGSFAVQLAKLVEARVVATTSKANADLVRSLGADEIIDRHAGDFASSLRDMDIVLDPIGGEAQARSWSVLRPGGVLVSLVKPTESAALARSDARMEQVVSSPNGARLEEVARLIDAQRLKVVVDRVFSLSDVEQAHELSRSGRARGKIVLRVETS